jgi:UDP-N-acetylglucosamine 2-epimerase (non-hydrolysing)/GDP/UDP-N,N'-diacetylbacillosamine 2-epimerase (hydrolysing)
VQCILTYPNNDAGGKQIIEALHDFTNKKIDGIQLHRSLGRYMYHGILSLALNFNYKVACLGNSSSGLKETPAFGCPSVNIGSRQEGRLRGENVIDVGYDEDAIFEAIERCFFNQEFRKTCAIAENPYWLGDAGSKIADILASVSLNQSILRKKMTLLGEEREGWYR